MRLALVGVSHHRAPVEVRERVAVDLDGARRLSQTLARCSEAVVLSTCNRTEVYLAGDHASLGKRAQDALLELAGREARSVEPVVYRLADESAALHLYRVAAGLDSLVPGEGEILGQVREALNVGRPGPVLGRLFRSALHVGRRARVETAIGESPASVPAAAAALAQQVFGDLSGRPALVVGAGRTSELTARNLLSRGVEVIAVANRTAGRAEGLAVAVGARPVALDDLASVLGEVDVVVSSTSAPGFVFRGDDVVAALRARRGRPILIVDVAVPRDVDPTLGEVDGCFVYDVDDLEAVVEASLAGRRAEAARAEQIVAYEAERFREWQASLAVVPAIASLHAHAEAIRLDELTRVARRLARLSEAERQTVEALTAQIVGKLLHQPTVRMKEASVTPDGVVYAEVMRHLFGLSDEDAT
jgi:glutamyl-tRNA reductase